jgi:hypothetical protein
MILILLIVSLLLALIPALLFLSNLREYLPPPEAGGGDSGAPLAGAVSVLIPARNEERSIRQAIEAVLASRGVELEVVVLDDHSEDATAELVGAMAQADSRVRLVRAPPLPPGWCGKQHACAVLAREARHTWLVFIDADVRLQPDGLSRMLLFQEKSGADLISGIPRQETLTWMECLVIPLIHFVLLGFLPIARMRRSLDPAYGAGCGQLFMARRAAYEAAGGHGRIRESLHDGLKLPRAFRSAGFSTDLFDATEIATCRMYRSAREVWNGLAKNATEGLATPKMIVPGTILLMGGQVAPFVLLLFAGYLSASELSVAAIATTIAYLPRLVAAILFRQSIMGGLMHPFGVWLLISIQWFAFLQSALGKAPAWKGREYRVRTTL